MVSEYFADCLMGAIKLDIDKDLLEIYGERYRELRDLAGVVGEDWKSILLALPDRIPWTVEGGLLYTPYLWLDAEYPDTWEREARLFACDCAERVLPVFEKANPDDDRPRRAIEVARRYAAGDATDREREEAHQHASFSTWDSASASSSNASSAACSVVTKAPACDSSASHFASLAADHWEDERDAQWKLLVDRLCREK